MNLMHNKTVIITGLQLENIYLVAIMLRLSATSILERKSVNYIRDITLLQ